MDANTYESFARRILEAGTPEALAAIREQIEREHPTARRERYALLRAVVGRRLEMLRRAS